MPLSKTGLGLDQRGLKFCALEIEISDCLCWQQWCHACSAPQQEESVGSLQKIADIQSSNGVIAQDSAYSAITTMSIKFVLTSSS